MNILFDYNRTLFNPETKSLYEGVDLLLAKLATCHSLYLITRIEPQRKKTLESLGIAHYFKEILFVSKKSASVFRSLALSNSRTLVVGDRIKEEIHIGNSLGYDTIWVKQGLFNTEIPTSSLETPTHTISNIQQLEDIILRYEK